MILRILGLIDIFSALIFLMIIFGMEVYWSILIFCAFLLLVKSLFIFSGELLSLIDLFSSILLFYSLFFAPFAFLIWAFALLLFAKGFVSFF